MRGSLLVIALVTAGVPNMLADDGMFPMSELPRVNLRERGIELTAEQLFNPSEISLVDGICRVNGCTGSFVSDSGLIITNHHCAFDAIQKASTSDRDLLTNGFIAGSRAEEIPAPDYQVRITENYRDISAEVLSVVQEGMSFLERTKAIEKRRKELEIEAERQHPGLRAEAAEMFAGRTYVLFLYTYLKDVRLVFAPPASVGNFGGEADNWEWPRHTGDFSFMRAYTAPDGSSATWSAQNIPYRPKRFLRVQSAGVDEGDAVFLLGYPGRTARHRTASFLQYESRVRLPLTVQLYQWQIRQMEEAGVGDRSVAIRHASRTKSLANVEKRSRGQLQGLQRAQIVEKRLQQESELQSFIEADEVLRQKYGSVLRDIAAVYAEMESAGPLEIHLQQLRQACRAAAFGFAVVDAVHERAKPDIERESPWMDRNYAQSVQELKVSLRDWHPPTDVQMLSGMLRRLSSIPGARQIPALIPLTESEQICEQAAKRLIEGTRLGDAGFIEQSLGQTVDQLRATKDPLLTLLLDLYPSYLQLRELDKTREGRLSRLYGSLLEVKEQFLRTGFIPDANGTLRFTSGRVRAYSPADAVVRTPISTLRGVIEKTTGQDPFITPEPVLRAYGARDFAGFLHPRLGQVPVAILYDTDTTGGNSGSPVLNSKGELVGVNFDRCFEATINDFAWNADYSRSIGVDIRYVLWITGRVYGATQLLDEMGVALAE
ncbi:MAG TPA: S46 family peptidase [Planctomycetaceae bacterium]|nr:S46 family peptidase [Planctomycetaceae bacterium]HBC60836.1 S46 family peptidase [Planctomycetaceae bacterium]